MRGMPDARLTAERTLTPRERVARVVLYLLLLAAAAAALLISPSTGGGEPGRRAPELLVAPVLFGIFVLGFGAYRLGAVRAGRYHAGKAFVQMGLLALVAVAFVPGTLEKWRASGAAPVFDLQRQLRSADADARAMAAELVRHRPPEDARRYVPTLVTLLGDRSPEVQRQARASLVALAGEDAGGEGPEAAARWRAFWAARGVPAGP
jgi:hypothetical protein